MDMLINLPLFMLLLIMLLSLKVNGVVVACVDGNQHPAIRTTSLMGTTTRCAGPLVVAQCNIGRMPRSACSICCLLYRARADRSPPRAAASDGTTRDGSRVSTPGVGVPVRGGTTSARRSKQTSNTYRLYRSVSARIVVAGTGPCRQRRRVRLIRPDQQGLLRRASIADDAHCNDDRPNTAVDDLTESPRRGCAAMGDYNAPE
jgi:hypothetical protein